MDAMNPAVDADQACGPFSGLRVLDISQGIAGPYCAQMLWQQGAEVIKVEPPAGDWGRHVGTQRDGHSALSVAYNAGKRGVCLDARHPQGKKALRRLAGSADVLIQNFRPGVAERMGVGYADVRQHAPGMVYVSISGYGPDGPYAGAPASDSVMQADSGLMYANQDEAGTPRRMGMLMADIATALYAAQATAAALYRQARTGRGSHVELSLFQACAALQVNDILAHAMAGARRAGPVSAPNGVFDTADGRLSVLALNNEQFARLCRALERPEWLQQPAYADNAGRMARLNELHEQIAAQLATRPSAHWIERLAREEVLHATVRDYDDLAAHAQAAHVELLQTLDQPGVGALPYAPLPGLARRRPLTPAPRIGQHSTAVLQDWGWSQADIRALMTAGALRQDDTQPEQA